MPWPLPFEQPGLVPRPDLIDFDKLKDSNARHNLEHAFDVAERQLGIIPLLDPEGELHLLQSSAAVMGSDGSQCSGWREPQTGRAPGGV